MHCSAGCLAGEGLQAAAACAGAAVRLDSGKGQVGRQELQPLCLPACCRPHLLYRGGQPKVIEGDQASLESLALSLRAWPSSDIRLEMIVGLGLGMPLPSALPLSWKGSVLLE